MREGWREGDKTDEKDRRGRLKLRQRNERSENDGQNRCEEKNIAKHWY